MSRQVAVASTSQIAADAGASVIEQGGNAVDAALAAALSSINTEPGVCSLGCGGYVTIWAPGAQPITIDGYVTTPGRGLPEAALGHGFNLGPGPRAGQRRLKKALREPK